MPILAISRAIPLTAHPLPFLAQQVAQHRGAGERVFQVQFVDPAHPRQGIRRVRPGGA